MSRKSSASLSGIALAATLAVSTLITGPQARAQMAGQKAAMPAPADTSPAGVIDQLITMVEHDVVPLAEAMPADKYDFAPTAGNFKGVRTFGQQIRHLTAANYGFFGDGASMKPNMPKLADLKTKEQLVEALKASFAFAHQAAATLTPDNALETVKPMDGISTRSGLMVFALIHANDHYGQLVEYLRMNGIVPPASR
jgi:uncharacterized damage-inducible protein DinB